MFKMELDKPLAALIRPKTLEEVVGQPAAVGDTGVISQMLKNKKPMSIILQGPPGSGKTTIAQIIIKEMGYQAVQASAVSATVKQIREIIDASKESIMGVWEPTILFLDEIHRF